MQDREEDREKIEGRIDCFLSLLFLIIRAAHRQSFSSTMYLLLLLLTISIFVEVSMIRSMYRAMYFLFQDDTTDREVRIPAGFLLGKNG